MRKALLIAAVVALFPALAARADLSWKQTSTTVLTLDGKETKVGESRENYQLKENVVRIDTESVPVSRFINFQNQRVVVVDFRTKTYAHLTLSDLIRQNNESRQEVMRSLPEREAALAQTPPEKREQAAAMIEAQKKKFTLWNPGRRYEVVVTEERAEINGHPCVKYLGRSDGEVFQEIWVAQDIALDRSYPTFFGQGMARLDPQQYSHLSRLPGFPVRVVSRYGAVTVTDDATNITDATIPAEAFVLPEGLSPAANVFEGQ